MNGCQPLPIRKYCCLEKHQIQKFDLLDHDTRFTMRILKKQLHTLYSCSGSTSTKAWTVGVIIGGNGKVSVMQTNKTLSRKNHSTLSALAPLGCWIAAISQIE